MERDNFFVFAFDNYYPFGGMGDLQVICERFDEAVQAGEELNERYDNVEIYSVETGSEWRYDEDKKSFERMARDYV